MVIDSDTLGGEEHDADAIILGRLKIKRWAWWRSGIDLWALRSEAGGSLNRRVRPRATPGPRIVANYFEIV